MSKSAAAFEHALAAGSALAESDFSTSEKQFAASEVLLHSARAELSAALAASQNILEIIDVTGTVRSGDQLLAAGEHLTQAGLLVSRGLSPLLDTNIVSNDDDRQSYTLVSALDQAQAELTKAESELAQAEEALGRVTVSALPNSVQQHVAILKAALPRAREPLGLFLKQSDTLLAVLGAERQREYLLLLENNDEIRPTGGFIGSLALINIDRGIVEKVDVKSVYDQDGQLRDYIAPPDPLRPITDRWFLRDANWFIDWKLSATKIAEFFEKEGGTTVDGIIALTPEVIQQLLIITGPIEVPEWNITVDAESLVAVTQDLVTYSYDRAQNRPKQFLADLTPQLLKRIFAGDPRSTLAVLDVLARMIQEKQLLINFRDSAEQARLTQLGWSSDFPDNEQGFLHVNNANIGGHKSDQFIEQEIDYRSTILENGDVDVVVTIRRTHNGPSEALQLPYPSGENPAFKNNIIYQRVLVPRAAQLLEATGFSRQSEVPRPLEIKQGKNSLTVTDAILRADPDIAEWQRTQLVHPSGTIIGQEAGYTSFANWMITKPGATVVGLYHYIIPQHAILPSLLKPANSYSVYLGKQAGDTRTNLRVEIMLPESVRLVHTVPADGVTQSDERTLVYRGRLQADRVVGAVFE